MVCLPAPFGKDASMVASPKIAVRSSWGFAPIQPRQASGRITSPISDLRLSLAEPRGRRPMLLTRAGCERIHEAALEVLSGVGVRIDDPAVVRALEGAGATLGAEDRVQMPARLVQWALAQAPRTIRIADRQGHCWDLGPDGGTLVLTGNALYVSQDRGRRDLQAADLADLARIVDACPNIYMAWWGPPLPIIRPPAVISSAFASWQRTRASTCGPAFTRRAGRARLWRWRRSCSTARVSASAPLSARVSAS